MTYDYHTIHCVPVGTDHNDERIDHMIYDYSDHPDFRKAIVEDRRHSCVTKLL